MKLGSEKNQLHFAILTFTNFHEWWNEHLLFLSCAQCIFKAKKLILVRNSLFLQGWGKKCSVIVITHYLICPFLVTNDKNIYSVLTHILVYDTVWLGLLTNKDTRTFVKLHHWIVYNYLRSSRLSLSWELREVSKLTNIIMTLRRP